ncbi:MAG: hypothetical protein J1F11_08960 [Oscillospiraceae bacterium]|nr:hypothetical protein [Oscillospiraceae bacterium]
MKKFLAAAFLTLLLLTGCKRIDEADYIPAAATVSVAESTDSTEPPSPAETEWEPEILPPYFVSDTLQEVSFYPSEDAVKRIGRFIEYKDVYYLSYTCSAVSFLMTGDRLEAEMTSNGNLYKAKQQCWMGVLIDGELIDRFQLEDGENTYTLYDGEMLEDAEVSIVRLTENPMAASGIVSITANAKMIAPVPEKRLTIEFVGDSITCGYGNEAESSSEGYNSAHQNGLETYGYYTAQALDADHNLVCYSGIGIISDCTTRTGVKENYLLMPEVYDNCDTNFEMRRGIEPYTEWDFQSGSDIVVINLGTNDYTYTGKNEDLQEEFRDAYYKFIGQVRKSNPEAEIICTLGILGSELYPQIEEAARMYEQDTGDTQIHTFEFDYQDGENDGFGGDFHPSIKTHQKAAEKLTEYIRSLSQ